MRSCPTNRGLPQVHGRGGGVFRARCACGAWSCKGNVSHRQMGPRMSILPTKRPKADGPLAVQDCDTSFARLPRVHRHDGALDASISRRPGPWQAQKSPHQLRAFCYFRDWLRGLDLNQRPSGYEPDELPDCSTPRHRFWRPETPKGPTLWGGPSTM